MYIKGISKVLIVISILVSLFLVTPSKVEALYDAPLFCPTGTIKVDGNIIVGTTNVLCCPTNSEYVNQIKKKFPSYTNISVSGGTFRDDATRIFSCKVKFNASDGARIINNELFEMLGTKAEFVCPVNSCTIIDASKTRCGSQLEPHPNYGKTNFDVCCISAKGTRGSFTKVPPCVPDNTIVAPQFNQAPKPIDADEICSKDSGTGNADDKRSSAEKGRIYGECMTCLQKSNYLWTGVGCMEATLNGVITTIIRIFYGIITALMLIKIIIAGYKYYGGDPEQLKDSKMEIFSAIGAAFALTLGIVALRYIGIDILGLGNIDGISLLPILK